MLGPQADEIQANIVKQYLEIGNKDGKAILGGKAGEGNYIHPTIFVDVDENSRIKFVFRFLLVLVLANCISTNKAKKKSLGRSLLYTSS